MDWESLLSPSQGEHKVLPWLGGRKVYGEGRTWTIQGKLPPEHGWYTFEVNSGRKASLVGEAEADPTYDVGRKTLKGYIVGDRLIPDGSRVDPNPEQLIHQTLPVALVEPGLDRFTRAQVAEREDGVLIFVRQEFPLGPEFEAEVAYQDRASTLDGIKDVSPGLDLSFRWLSLQRVLAEERRARLERERQALEAQRREEERLRQLRENLGSADTRRVVARTDFATAAESALKLTNSELLDTRPGYNRNEMIVQYRVRHRRLECVVDKTTMRVIDAGICLQDHRTGRKDDNLLTLESLPSVVEEALDLGKLVVWRHAPGDNRQFNDDAHEGEDDEW